MMVLRAVKVAPNTVDSLSGYRTFLAGLQADDISAKARAIIAAAGVLGFLVLGYLALRQLPLPRPARPRAASRRGRRPPEVSPWRDPARAGYPHPRST